MNIFKYSPSDDISFYNVDAIYGNLAIQIENIFKTTEYVYQLGYLNSLQQN